MLRPRINQSGASEHERIRKVLQLISHESVYGNTMGIFHPSKKREREMKGKERGLERIETVNPYRWLLYALLWEKKIPFGKGSKGITVVRCIMDIYPWGQTGERGSSVSRPFLYNAVARHMFYTCHRFFFLQTLLLLQYSKYTERLIHARAIEDRQDFRASHYSPSSTLHKLPRKVKGRKSRFLYVQVHNSKRFLSNKD